MGNKGKNHKPLRAVTQQVLVSEKRNNKSYKAKRYNNQNLNMAVFSKQVKQNRKNNGAKTAFGKKRLGTNG
jgi:hypothetical protein